MITVGRFGADELIEGLCQKLTEGSCPQHRVDIGQVVVESASMCSDEIAQRVLHQVDALFRDAEGDAQIAKIVVVTGSGDGIQQG